MGNEELKEQAFQTNDLISSYILFHNEIIKNTSSLKNLFRKVDFEKPYLQSKEMLNNFEDKKEELYALQKKLDKTLEADKRRYLRQLICLAEKATDAVSLLVERQKIHYDKSRGDTRSWQDFARIHKEYQKAIDQYVKEKDRLVSLSYLIS